jgi:O-antigen/teichoic acid export membrane protein
MIDERKPLNKKNDPASCITRHTRIKMNGLSITGNTNEGRKAPSIRRNFCWMFVANVVYAICQWGVLICLAKIGSPEKVGEFGLGLAITTPVMLFTGLQLRTVQATDARRDYPLSQYVALTILSTLLGMIVIIILVITGKYNRDTALIIVAVGMGKGFTNIGEAIYGMFQRIEKMDYVARGMMIQGIISVAAMGIVLLASRSAIWGAVSWAVAAGITLFAYIVPTACLLSHDKRGMLTNENSKQVSKWRHGTLLRLGWEALPLGIVTLLSSLEINLPRYFVAAQRGTSELGIFIALAYVTVGETMIGGSLSQAASPRLANYYVTGEKEAFRHLILRLALLGALIAVIGIISVVVAGRILVTLLYSSEYADHSAILVWLTIGSSFTLVAMLLGSGIAAARRYTTQAVLFMSLVGITALCAALLVPHYGMMGGAMTVAISGSCEMVGSSVIIISIISGINKSNKGTRKG